jgi:hypothetical protein
MASTTRPICASAWARKAARFHQTHGPWLITFALARKILLAQGIEFAEDGNHRLPQVAVNAVGIPAAASWIMKPPVRISSRRSAEDFFSRKPSSGVSQI